MSLSLSPWYPESGVVLDCIEVPDLCTLTLLVRDSPESLFYVLEQDTFFVS